MLVRSLIVSGLLQTRRLPLTLSSRPLTSHLCCIVDPVRRQYTHCPAATAHLEERSMTHLEALPPAPVLQRDLFNESLQLKALRIPKKECQKYMKLLAGYA